MLQICEGAADTEGAAPCRSIRAPVLLTMRCLQNYSRNLAGQTFDIDFLCPWTVPASIRIYFPLIYPRRIEKDTDKKGFHGLRSCTARYPDISGIKMAAAFREGGLSAA